MAISVLIAEDDRNIAELLQMYLEKEGYAVTVANDGGQGLAKFRAIKPDLVLLDVMMPVMDGVGLYIQNRGFRVGQKEPQARRQFHGAGRLHPRKRGGVPLPHAGADGSASSS